MDDVEKLIKNLKLGDVAIRYDATWRLGDIGDALLRSGASRQSQEYQELCNVVVPALVEALDDENVTVRTGAAVALGMIRDASAVPALVEALGDEDANVRGGAAVALGKIGDASAGSAMAKVIGDEDTAVGYWAAEALGKIVDKCEMIEFLESFEKSLKEGFTAFKKRCRDKDRTIQAMMDIAKLMKKISEKKNELISKKDMLLDDKPKPPKKGGMYQAARRVRNG